jgi:hypothetical protein
MLICRAFLRRLGALVPANSLDVSPADRDLWIRTVIGEAATDPASQPAVAHVIANRIRDTGQSPSQVVLAPNQFEPWNNRARELLSASPNSAPYKAVAKVVDGVIAGSLPDPTNGATQFYAPAAQKALGRKPPAWDDGTGVQIGAHKFFGGSAQPAGPSGDDLLKMYTKSATPVPASPSAPVGPDDDALLQTYMKPGAVPVAPAAITPGAPMRLALDPQGNTIVEAAPPAAPPAAPIPPDVHGYIRSKLAAVPGAVGSAFTSGLGTATSGLADIYAGNVAPSFPSADPRTWSAGGALKAAAGIGSALMSPITGLVQKGVEEPATELTGNPEFGSRLGFVANSLAGPAVGALAGRVAGSVAPEARAMSEIRNAIGTVAPEDAATRLAANPNLRLMDVNPQLQANALGLANTPGPARDILKGAVEQSRAAAPDVASEAFDAAMGKTPDVKQYLENLEATKQANAKTGYGEALKNAKPVDISPVLDRLDAIEGGQKPGVPQTTAQAAAADIKSMLVEALPQEAAAGAEEGGLSIPKAAGREQSAFEYLAMRGGLAKDNELASILDKNNPVVPGKGRLVRNQGGLSLDQSLEALKEGGYLHDPGDYAGGGEATLGHSDVLDLIAQEARGNKVYPIGSTMNMHAATDAAETVRHAQTMMNVRDAVNKSGSWVGAPNEAHVDRAAQFVNQGIEKDPVNAYERAEEEAATRAANRPEGLGGQAPPQATAAPAPAPKSTVPAEPPAYPQAVPYDPQKLHEVQSYLRTAAEREYQRGDMASGIKARQLKEARDGIIKALDDATGGKYSEARIKYREDSSVEDAFEKGGTFAKNGTLEDRPEYWKAWKDAASPEEIEAAKVGMRVKADQTINGTRFSARNGQNIPAVPFNLEKMKIILGDTEAKLLAKRMEDSRAIEQTNALLFNGSKTALTQAAQRATAVREPGAVSGLGAPAVMGLLAEHLGAGNVGGLAAAAVPYLWQHLGRQSDIARNTAMARILAQPGVNALNQLRPRQSAPGLIGQYARGLGQGVPAAFLGVRQKPVNSNALSE